MSRRDLVFLCFCMYYSFTYASRFFTMHWKCNQYTWNVENLNGSCSNFQVRYYLVKMDAV